MPPVRSIRSLIAVLATLALGGAACGSDSGPSLGDYAAAIAAAISSDDQDAALEISDDEAGCIGDGAAAAIGLEALEAAGTPEEVEELAQDDLSVFDLTTDEATEVARIVISCAPSTDEQFVASLQLDDDTAACVVDRLESDDLATVLGTSLRGDDPSEVAEETFGALVQACDDGDGDSDNGSSGESSAGDGDPANDGDGPSATSGGEDSSDAWADRDAYVDTLAADLTADGTFPIDDREARCVAGRIVDIVGQDRATSLGGPDAFASAPNEDLDALGLDAAELEAIGDGLFRCVPGIADDFRDSFVADGGLSAAEERCVRDVLTDERIREVVIVSSASNADDPMLDEFYDDIEACVE